ncbi:hypothetical protein X797_008106 [Metarhizium robertsii]|uniref:Uncharacterized protein n=2 Tax=Metarhizium robertsii TaxID=568076 RepID=E9EJK9_METRA|nr:uncharacterized protein MAA_00079 [Metarhizium robertsii ARSEF 23]EFZ03005.1 hypothetical protein MAA_00079 [Metarhizium robertsii ARSEF 23]EXU98869.1 hypothetical protein X797_008106 [Metarhizium robertsii]
MASPIWLFSLLQVFLGLAGMTWKLSEGYPIMHVHAALDASSWLEMCTGTSAASFQSNWPWFMLHLVLYAGQLAGFVLIVLHETVPHTGPVRGFGYVHRRAISFLPPAPANANHDARRSLVAAMACISCCFGFSTAMPIVSLWIHVLHRRPAQSVAAGQARKLALRTAFWLTGVTHVGAFLVAFAATAVSRDRGPFHLMNSLLGVPDCSVSQLACAPAAQGQARVRQMNEMTGTSSGFFLAMGLFCQALAAAGRRMGWRLLARMFLVSLVVGPAAGAADALVLRDALIGLGDGTRDHRETRKSE